MLLFYFDIKKDTPIVDLCQFFVCSFLGSLRSLRSLRSFRFLGS